MKRALGTWGRSVQRIPGDRIMAEHKEGQGASKTGRAVGMGRVPTYFLRWGD